MANVKADEMLRDHAPYTNDDRMGNRWYQGRYKAGIKEFGYPIRLPSEQWGTLAKMRGGIPKKKSSQVQRTKQYEEQANERSGRNDHEQPAREYDFSRNWHESRKA